MELYLYSPRSVRLHGEHRNEFAFSMFFTNDVNNTRMSFVSTFKSLVVSLFTTRYNIQKFYMVLALRSVFCTDLRPDSDFYFIQH